jgi:hypothetical protein
MGSQLAQTSQVSKIGPGAASDGLNNQCRNRFLQQVGMPQSIQIHLLLRSLNGPMTLFLEITVFLAILEHHSNCRGASNDRIALPW